MRGLFDWLVEFLFKAQHLNVFRNSSKLINIGIVDLQLYSESMSFCQKIRSCILRLDSFRNLGCHDLATILIYNIAMCMVTKLTWSDLIMVLLFLFMVTITWIPFWNLACCQCIAKLSFSPNSTGCCSLNFVSYITFPPVKLMKTEPQIILISLFQHVELFNCLIGTSSCFADSLLFCLSVRYSKRPFWLFPFIGPLSRAPFSCWKN